MRIYYVFMAIQLTLGDPNIKHHSFRGPCLTPDQEQFNKSMSKVEVTVEYLFKEIINYFNFMNFKKNLKVRLNAVGKCTLFVLFYKTAEHVYMETKFVNSSSVTHKISKLTWYDEKEHFLIFYNVIL